APPRLASVHASLSPFRVRQTAGSDNAEPRQLGHFVVRVTELLKDLGGVFAVHGGRAPQGSALAIETQGLRDAAQAAESGMLVLEHHATGRGVRMCRQL